MKNMKKKLISLAMVVVMVLTTFLPGVGTLTAEAATTAEDQMIVTSPWAYRYGSMDNSQTYTDGGYEYATLITGSGTANNGALMRDVQLSDYQEIRFAVKTNGSYYYEGGRAANSEWSMISGANTTWREWTFKYEADSNGNMGYRLYRDGSVFGDYFLSEDANLSDLQMKFSSNTAGILYMTEVRGTLRKENSLKIVADSFNDKTGTTIWTEKANGVARKTTQVTTSWSGTQGALTAVDLSNYDKILFYARRTVTGASATWFESSVLGSYNDFGDNWVEFKFEKNTDGTWNYYLGGVQKGTSLALTNLSEITATYGNNTYYFSEVFGIYSEGVEIPWIGEYMVVTSPWAYRYGSMDNSQTYTEGGYEYATLVPGSGTANNGALMRDVQLSEYQELRFAVKTNGSYYYEAGKVADGNFSLFSGAPTSWREYILRYENGGDGAEGYRLYRKNYGENESNQNILLPADMNLSDLQMKFSSNTAGMLYMTEVRGTLKDGAEPSLKMVADSFNDKMGTVVWTEKPNIAAKKSTSVTTSWSSTRTALTSVDMSNYDKILFYARRAVTGASATYFESEILGTNNDLSNDWTEFKFVKNTDGTWNYYLGGVQKSTNLALTNLSEITATYGNNTYYFSEVFGIPSAEEETPAPELWGDMVVTSPWAYQYGTTVNDQSQTADGYEYVTTIVGNSKAYDLQATMKDFDMSVYSEFRFAVKTGGGTYDKYQIKKTGNNTTFETDSLFSGQNETEWTEYTFVCEKDSAGNEKFHVYKVGADTNVWLPATMNLSDLQMRATYITSETLYLTEVRGTLKEGAVIPLEIVADSFNTLTGETVTTEAPNAVATKATKVSTGYWNNEQPLISVDLKAYDKLLFYARKAGDGTGWFESANHLSSFAIDYTWVEFKLVQNDDDTWNIYVGGVLKNSNLTLNNLSDVTAKYGINNYYFSEVFGVLSDDVTADVIGLVQLLKARAAYKTDKNTYNKKYDLLLNDVINWQDAKWLRQDILDTSHEFVVVTSPWAYLKGSIDNSQTYATAGYEYATLVPGGQVYYDKPFMKDVDMSIYSEFRFALKTNGTYWYQGGIAANDDEETLVGANTDWREYSFKYEDDGAGNVGFHMYKDGVATSTWLSEDFNLSDLKMKFSADTNGILYMTEVRGVAKKGSRLPLEVVTGSFNAETGTTLEKEAAIIDATMSTEVKTKHSYTQNALTSVDLSLYDKILFYARKTSSSYDTNAWLESNYLGSFVVTDNWTEFKLVKNEDDTWNIYVGGLLKQSNLALTNLSDITATYGNDTYYFSEVFGISTADPIVLLDEYNQAIYSVAYKASSESFAANEFTTYMESATGVAYTATQVSSIPETDENKIVIGADLASEAGLSTSELTTDNGYAIKRLGNNLYVYGKTTQGTLNGVYALLKDAVGLEIYTDEVATETYEGGEIILKNTNAVFNPGIDYLYDMNRETRDNTTYGKKLGFTLDWNHLGGSDHEESVFISSSYYSGTASNGHVDLTNATTQQEVAQYLYDTYVVGKPGLSDFRFGLADDTNWFNSTTVGSTRTSQYVAFMNQVAAKLQALMEANGTQRDVNLILLAYLNTVQAPTYGTTFANTENITLQVAYAPLEANWYMPLSHEDNNSIPSEVSSSVTYDADAELQKWADIAGEGNVLLWAYHAFPGNYLTPFDSLNALQKNYALAAQCGVSAVYDIAQWAPDARDGATLGDGNDTSTDWTRLKVYLSNELAKNPTMSDAEYNQLIDNFMNAYFIVEEVATAMKEALSAERTLMETVYANVKGIGNVSYDETCGFDDYYGSVGGYHTLIDQTVTSWLGGKNSNTRNAAWGWSGSGDHPMMAVYTKMKVAYDAVATAQTSGTITAEEAAILKERIQIEAISVRFILLRVASQDVSSSFDGQSGYAGLAADCLALGITKLGENSNGGSINRDMTADNLQKNDL